MENKERISLALTPLQQGMLFQTHYEENRAFYHNRAVIELGEPVHYPFIQLAVQQLIDRYEALRSSFSLSEFTALVHPKVKVKVTQADYSRLSEGAQKKRIETYFFEDAKKGFDLEKPPLVRFRLLQLGEKKYQLLITYHHVIFGGHCDVAIIRDLLTYYDILLGRSLLPPPPLDNCQRYRTALDAFNFEEAKSYWKNLLGSYSEPCQLPEKLEKSLEQRPRHASLSFALGDDFEKIKTFCRSQRITSSFFFHLAWGLLLQYYCDKEQVVFGVTKEFPKKDIGNQAGLFINTLPMSLSCVEGISIKQLIEQLREQHHKASDYIYTPLQQIKALSNISPLESLFYSLIDFKIYSPNTYLSLHYPYWENRSIHFESPTEYPILIEIYGEASGFFGRLTYQAANFTADFIHQVVGHYQQIIHQLMCSDANTLLTDISPLTAAEKNILLQDWSGADYSAAAYSSDLFSLFEKTALKYPNHMALIDKTRELTYSTLYQEVQVLAEQFRELGVGNINDRVVLCLPRCHQFSIAVLALQKLKATYIPVDPEIPEARMNIIMEDCQPVLIFSTHILLEKFQKTLPFNINRLTLEDLKKKHTIASIAQEQNLVESIKHTAYIIYTSGSTGMPKGVMIGEASLVNLLLSVGFILKLKAGNRFLATSAFSFDNSGLELLLPLITGATCVIADEEAIRDAQAITALIQRHQIDCMQGTPSYWQMLLNNGFSPLPTMQLLSSGEFLPVWVAQELMRNQARVWNSYGPTETTILCAAYRIKFSDLKSARLPFGHLFHNTEAYILNRKKQLMPAGVPGELYIGGVGVSEGYLNRKELNDLCFVPNPFKEGKYKTLYKSGDRACWSQEGLLYPMGRVDDQIKLRGYRIEPGEINHVFKKHPQVKHAITILSDKASTPQLITYYVSDQRIDVNELKKIASDHLPVYMLPTHIIHLTTIPLTINGKINRDLLPEPQISNQQLQLPLSPYAEKIRQIWADVLQIPVLNIAWQDDFFEIGGDSIAATLVIAKLSTQANRRLSIKLLFTHPTLEKLYYYLQRTSLEFAQLSPIQQAPMMEHYPLSFEQQSLWFIQQMTPESTVYNMFVAFSLTGQLNIQALQQAFSRLIEKHSILRTRLITEAGKALQVMDAFTAAPMEIHPAQDLSEQVLRDYAYALAQQPFDLKREWPIRVHLLQSTAEQYSLFISLHHIAADGWSMGILTRELSELYSDCSEIKNAVLPSASFSLQYVDFAVWQQEQNQSVMREHLAYWAEQLQQLPTLSLPFDERRSDNLNYRGERIAFAIDAKLTQRLTKFSIDQHCTLFMSLFTAFSILLYKYSGQDDFAMGIPVSGRQHPNVDNIVGLFVNFLVIRQCFEKDLDFLALLKQTKETLLEAFAHQEAPFEKVVENSHVARHLNMHPLCQVFFVMQDFQMEADLKLKDIKIQRIFSDNEALLLADYETAKFDLTFYMRQGKNGLEGLVEFNADLFQADTIQEWIKRYQYLLEEVLSQPEQPIDCLTLYSPDEKTQDHFFPIVQQPLPYQSMVEGFEQQVALYPDKIALRYQEAFLTYTQLNERANQLANYLLQQFGPQPFIGICLERSLDMIVSILAVLKMGAAYVPIDPQYPLTRIRYVLKDANIGLLLTKFSDLSSRLIDELQSKPITFFLDKLSGKIKKHASLKPCLKKLIQAENIAYVLYTSGSTGVPKGILVSHENVIRLFQSSKNLYHFSMEDVWALSHSFSFDFSVWEMWGALLQGSELIVVSQAELNSPKQMNQLLSVSKVTVLNYTPSVFSQWVSELHISKKTVSDLLCSLRLIILGGESIVNANLERWYTLSTTAQQVNLFNLYGPTETTVYNTYHKIQLSDLLARPIDNIGKPMAGKCVHILNPQCCPVALGMVGEICIQGHGLSPGYLGKPELSKEKFIEVKGADQSLIPLYCSGDLGRHLANGDIEYLGRRDQQVKLRGFRIELNAIKESLMQHERVDQAIVVMDENRQEKRLIAYVVPKPAPQVRFKVELSSEHRQRWQALYDRVYAAQQALENPWFNTVGWHSSYTGEAIAADIMQAWVDGAVERILKLSPKKVLEIGCGTGLLLSRIAPSTELYHATDISEQAIAYIQATLESSPIAHGILTLTCRSADLIDDDEKNCYDLVIINSVVQYFSDVDYLGYVLSRALDSVKPAGHIFIGDVRSLAHIDLFHARVLLSKEAPSGTSVSLGQAIAQKHAQEAELLLEPHFFRQFARENQDRISSLRVDIKSSPFFDEMTAFRYDIVLSISNTINNAAADQPIQCFNWEAVESVEEIARLLQEPSGDYLAIKQIPNQRLYGLAGFLRQSMDFSLKAAYVEWQKRCSSLQGVNPSDLYQLSKEHGYEIYITWSMRDSLSYFDVIFYKENSKQILESFLKDQCKEVFSDTHQLANNPLNLEDKKKLSRLLKKHLKQALPEYMHPQAIISIDSIPVTRHGKINLAALPKIQIRSVLSSIENELDPIEKKLLGIWQELLVINHIELEDDFFDLGGYSIIALQMLYAVEKIFSITVPIHCFFSASTLGAFANLVRAHLLDKKMQLSGIEYKPHEQSSIICLSSKGNKTPCFFFHPVGGTIFPYIPLVRELNLDRPYYAIQDPGIYAKKILFNSIEEMVACYIQYIRRIQPKGPYLLLGASMGGTLAFEAAAQLIQQGERVDMIAMFDGWALLTEEFGDKERLDKIMMRQYKMTQLRLDQALVPNPKMWLDINHHRTKLLFDYKIPSINEKVILFKCQELYPEFISMDCSDNHWSKFALKGVDVYSITGNHETMMIEPQVKEIASVLNRLLAEKNKSLEKLLS